MYGLKYRWLAPRPIIETREGKKHSQLRSQAAGGTAVDATPLFGAKWVQVFLGNNKFCSTAIKAD